jgi:hypothetical protein
MYLFDYLVEARRAVRQALGLKTGSISIQRYPNEVYRHLGPEGQRLWKETGLPVESCAMNLLELRTIVGQMGILASCQGPIYNENQLLLDLRPIPLKASKKRCQKMHPSFAEFVAHNWELPVVQNPNELMAEGAHKAWRNRRGRIAA